MSEGLEDSLSCDLLDRVIAARGNYLFVFNMPEDARRDDWEDVFRAIKARAYSQDEKERLGMMEPDWYNEVIVQQNWPSAWVELKNTVRKKWKKHIQDAATQAETALPPDQRGTVQAVTEKVLVDLIDFIIRNCGKLRELLAESGKLDRRLSKYISDRVAALMVPIKIVKDYSALKALRRACEDYYFTLTGQKRQDVCAQYQSNIQANREVIARQELGIKAGAQITQDQVKNGCPYSDAYVVRYVISKLLNRDKLNALRRKEACRRLREDKEECRRRGMSTDQVTMDSVSADDLTRYCPLPGPLLHLNNLLASDLRPLLTLMEYHAAIALRNSKGPNTPAIEEVLSEFFMLKSMRLGKCAGMYLERRWERTPDSWAPCLFNSFEKDRKNAVKYAAKMEPLERSLRVYIWDPSNFRGENDTVIDSPDDSGRKQSRLDKRRVEQIDEHDKSESMPSKDEATLDKAIAADLRREAEEEEEIRKRDGNRREKQKMNWIDRALELLPEDIKDKRKHYRGTLYELAKDREAYCKKHNITVESLNALAAAVREVIKQYARKSPPPGYSSAER